MIHDFKFALRQLGKTPGFTAAAVLVLALGIGTNTAVFNLVHTLFFAPPPYARPAELVQVFSQDVKNPKMYRGFSYPTYRDIREQNSVFTDLVGYNLALVGIGQKDETRRAFAAVVSSNYFSTLGVPLAQGRTFLPEEESPGRNATSAIVSYSYWLKHERPSLGSQMTINGRPFTIVGVAPKDFTIELHVFTPEVWLPLSAYDAVVNDFQDSQGKAAFGDRAAEHLILVARLRPGLTASTAAPPMRALATQLEQAFPVEQKNQTFVVAPISKTSIGTSPQEGDDVMQVAPLLLGMAVMVLLVACLNLANMLLARGTSRRKEIAIRLAVGGSRSRIVRQLLTEGLVLALLGGIGGLVLGVWSSSLLVGSLQKMLPIDLVWLSRPDFAILSATFAFSLLAAVAFGLGPAWKLSRGSVIDDLKEQAGEDVVRRRWRFLPRYPLVLLQIAFSLALLTAAALFIRGAGKAANIETGLKPGASFLLETDASLVGYDAARAQQLYRTLRERLAGLPGVEQASISATVPFGMIKLSKNVRRAGIRPGPDQKPASAADGLTFHAQWNGVGAEYFSTVGLSMLRGRAFTDAEATQADAPPVAIIDDALAKKLWPNGDALGQSIAIEGDKAGAAQKSGEAQPQAERSYEIVGIVPTTRHSLFEKAHEGAIYVPFAGGFQSDVTIFVRFRSLAPGSEAAAAQMIRRTVRDIDPSLPIISLRTFAQHLDANMQLWIVRAGAAMFSIFGFLALGLAVVGLYGVKAYAVARRTREIGIRMALGAQRNALLAMFMREGAVMLGCGIALGLLLAMGAAKILSGILYQVGPLDPVAFTVAPVVLAAAALVATWLPARRATRVNPIRALRTE